jgi:hypothetical protein
MGGPGRFRDLVQKISESAHARYPSLTRGSVLEAVDAFLAALPQARPQG